MYIYADRAVLLLAESRRVRLSLGLVFDPPLVFRETRDTLCQRLHLKSKQ